MKLRTRIQSGLVALGLLLGMGVAAAAPADAATLKGGVSIANACAIQHATNAELVAWNVYGWHCIYRGATWPFQRVDWGGVDLNRECVTEYGSGAYARYLDYNNPYSWRCYS